MNKKAIFCLPLMLSAAFLADNALAATAAPNEICEVGNVCNFNVSGHSSGREVQINGLVPGHVYHCDFNLTSGQVSYTVSHIEPAEVSVNPLSGNLTAWSTINAANAKLQPIVRYSFKSDALGRNHFNVYCRQTA